MTVAQLPLRTLSLLALLSLFLIGVPCPYESCVAQSNFVTSDRFVEDVVLDQLPISTAVAFGPEGRVYIALKEGIIRVAQNGSLLPTPFIDISKETNKNTDRGLLGLALDPQFPTRPFVYMLYVFDPPDKTADSTDPRAVRLVRVQADAAKGYNVALDGSMEIILGRNSVSQNMAVPIDVKAPTIPEPASCMTGNTIDGTPIEDCLPVDGRSHSAGTLIFGDDGSLYLSVGDGSSYDGANRPGLRTQMIDSLAGKVLRIDPNTGSGLPGNPFFDANAPSSNRSRVWAYGLRNPFRMTLNPSNGQVYLGDVGSSGWEEVNAGKGMNFGWPCYEGGVSPNAGTTESGDTVSLKNQSYANFNRTKDLCSAVYALGEAGVRSPIFSYAHIYKDGKDQGGSVTGTAFYSGSLYPAHYRGALFIADYALKTLRYLTFDQNGKAFVNPFAVETGSGLGVVQLLSGPDSNIYALYLDLVTRSSQLRRFRYIGDGNSPPQLRLKSDRTAGSVPLTVSFRTDGTFDPDGQPLKYSWNFGDGTPGSTSPNPVHVYQDVGTYTATVTVSEATPPGAETKASLTIRTGVTPPKAFIDTPVSGFTYAIGTRVDFSGHATFDVPGAPPAVLTWSIIQHHNDHTHLEDEVTGASGSFLVEEHADNTFYELCLFADGGPGLQDQVCRTIQPVHTEYTLQSVPIGAAITYVDEGYDVLAPYVIRPIRGSNQTLIASGVHADRSFVRWSDGVTDRQRSFITDNRPGTFTAVYENLPPKASFTSSTLKGAAPLALSFDASSSSDPEGTLLSFNWDFGDGATAAGSQAQHTFTTPGDYSVTLTATDKLGASASKIAVVSVSEPQIELPQVTFTPPLTLRTSPTAKRCGTAASPCRIRSGSSIEATSKLRLEDALLITGLDLVVEVRSGKTPFSQVASTFVPRKGSASVGSKVKTKGLKVGSTYRVKFTVRDLAGRAAKSSRYAYFTIVRR